MRLASAFLTGLCTLAMTSVVVAQSTDSHVPIPDWGGGAGSPRNSSDLAKQLKGRLGQRPTSGTPQMNEEMAARIRDMLASKSKEEWGQYLRDHPQLLDAVRDGAGNPAFREEILKQVQNVDKGTRTRQLKELEEAFGKKPPTSTSGQTSNDPGRTTTAKPPSTSTPTIPRSTGSGGPQSTVPRALNGLTNKGNPRFDNPKSQDFAKSLERWFGKSMNESPAMKRFGSDLGKKDWGKILDSAMNRAGNGPKINWSKLGNRLQGTGRFLDRHAPSFSGTRLPRVPNVNTPNLPRGPNLPSMGGPPTAGAAAAGGSMTAVMVVLGIAVAAYLFWRLVLRPMNQAQRAVRAEDSFGPWPVDPSQIRTREELVRAFDYLALRSYGKPARMLHHLELANKFGSDQQERRQSAFHLAETYAHARYAPPAERLEEAAARQARHDLCALAGEAAP